MTAATIIRTAAMNIRLTIEEVFGDKTEIIHLNVQEVEPGFTRNQTLRFMLAAAGECFPDDRPKPPLQTYPYDAQK